MTVVDDDWEEGYGAPRDEEGLWQRQEFLSIVAAGTLPELAALEVGWNPRKLKQVMADRQFAELVVEAQGILDARVEQVVVGRALAGNEWAVKMYLFNRKPKDWRDVRHIDVKATPGVDPAIVALTREAVREGVLDVLRGGRDGIAVLQRNIIEAREAAQHELEQETA